MSNSGRWRDLMQYIRNYPKCTKEDILKEIEQIKSEKCPIKRTNVL